MARVIASGSPSSSRLLGKGNSDGEAEAIGSDDWPSPSLVKKRRNGMVVGDYWPWLVLFEKKFDGRKETSSTVKIGVRSG